MEYQAGNGQIQIGLPMTTPTGKIRVKRPISGFASEPLACRSCPIQDTDYLEWQISYDTDSLNEPSVLKDIVLNKEQGVRYGCELVSLIVSAKKMGVLPSNTFAKLQELVFTPLEAGIEEIEKIRRETDSEAQTIAKNFGFTRNFLRVPNYIRTTDTYEVEIKIAHKQRAVGNQAMVYVNLPLRLCSSENNIPIIRRCAEKAEKAYYIINKSNVNLIYDSVVAFALASIRHRKDLRMIFEKL